MASDIPSKYFVVVFVKLGVSLHVDWKMTNFLEHLSIGYLNQVWQSFTFLKTF